MSPGAGQSGGPDEQGGFSSGGGFVSSGVSKTPAAVPVVPTPQSPGAAPFTPRAYPKDPTMPSAAPDGYITPNSPGSPSTFEPPKTPAQIDSLRNNFLEVLIQQIVKAFTGFFLPGGGSAVSQLTNIAQNIPFVGPFIQAGNQLWNKLFDTFTGGAGSSGKNLDDVQSGGQGVFGAISGNFGGAGNFITDIIQRFLNVSPFGALLGGGVFGSVRPKNTTAVSGSAIGGRATATAGGQGGGGSNPYNLLVNPTFDTNNALDTSANGWSWNSGAGAGGGGG